MSVSDFMKREMHGIKEIIDTMPDKEFDSHQFIRRFAKKYEAEYVGFLGLYHQEPFRKVHGQIAKFLSENKTKLRIEELGKVNSENIFGEISENEKWKRQPALNKLTAIIGLSGNDF